MHHRQTEEPRLGLDPLDTTQEPRVQDSAADDKRVDEKREDGHSPSIKPSTQWVRRVSIGVLSLLIAGMLLGHFHDQLVRMRPHPRVDRASLPRQASHTTSVVTNNSEMQVAADHARLQVLTQSVSDLTQQAAAQFKTVQASITSLNAAQQQMNAQLKSLQSTLQQNSTDDLSATVSLLQTQVTQLNNTIQAMKTQAAASKALPVTALPFQPLSVNSWGGVPYVLVNVSNEDTLVRQGDTVQGWTLSSVDYPTQTVVFEDRQHHVARLVL